MKNTTEISERDEASESIQTARAAVVSNLRDTLIDAPAGDAQQLLGATEALFEVADRGGQAVDAWLNHTDIHPDGRREHAAEAAQEAREGFDKIKAQAETAAVVIAAQAEVAAFKPGSRTDQLKADLQATLAVADDKKAAFEALFADADSDMIALAASEFGRRIGRTLGVDDAHLDLHRQRALQHLAKGDGKRAAAAQAAERARGLISVVGAAAGLAQQQLRRATRVAA